MSVPDKAGSLTATRGLVGSIGLPVMTANAAKLTKNKQINLFNPVQRAFSASFVFWSRIFCKGAMT